MITIFTSCKPFTGEDRRAQRNAIGSWKALKPQPEILILGDDEGVAEVANEYNVTNIPGIETSNFGKPLVSSVFEQAQRVANSEYLCYVNSDIILMSDFMSAFKRTKSKYRDFLLIGKRYDLDVTEYLSFDDQWEKEFRKRADREAELYPLKGIDYFVFRRGEWVLPPFVLGSIRWDNWMILEGRRKRIPVVDATESVRAVHQNHKITRSLGLGKDRFDSDPIALNNLALYGDKLPAFDNLDATHEVTSKSVRRSYSPDRIVRWMQTERVISPELSKLRKLHFRLLRFLVKVQSKFSNN